MKIKCPNCDRVLGDTEKSLDCYLNCRGCRNMVKINVKIAETNDYFKYRKENYD